MGTTTIVLLVVGSVLVILAVIVILVSARSSSRTSANASDNEGIAKGALTGFFSNSKGSMDTWRRDPTDSR